MKRVFLFLAIQLLLFGGFYLTLNLYSNSNFFNPKGKNIAIEIVSGNTENHSLVLDPPDTVSGWGRKKVTWSIDSTAAIVESFEIVKKESSPQLFQWIDREPRSQTRNGKGRFKNISKDVDYVYSIIWYDTMGLKHTFDPKIAVKPSSFLLEVLIYIVYALFAGLISFLTFRKK
jgi:hypothetical protein